MLKASRRTIFWMRDESRHSLHPFPSPENVGAGKTRDNASLFLKKKKRRQLQQPLSSTTPTQSSMRFDSMWSSGARFRIRSNGKSRRKPHDCFSTGENIRLKPRDRSSAKSKQLKQRFG